MSEPRELPLVVIVGPTASGKSKLAVWLALQAGGEVIACDSTQMYRGFDIGTAKPSAEERQGVPHHMMDLLDPGEEATAGGYRERAIGVLEDLRVRQRLPILTAGTGLYLRALLEGLADVPQRSESLREIANERGGARPGTFAPDLAVARSHLCGKDCSRRRAEADTHNRSVPAGEEADVGSATERKDTLARLASCEDRVTART